MAGLRFVFELRVLQKEAASPGRRFFCPLVVGNPNKRLRISFRIGELLTAIGAYVIDATEDRVAFL